MTETEIDKLLDVYENINRDDVPSRETFWGVLKALGKASEFMEVLRRDDDD